VLAEGLERSGVRVDLEIDDAADLPRPAAELLHRAALEALRNVVTHSGASRVALAVRRTGRDVQLAVDDDGRGFDEAYLAGSRVRGHVGLQALGDRLRAAGGSLSIESDPGSGTRILARVPLDADSDARPDVPEVAPAAAVHRPLSRSDR
jgi:signal transduction histidine kinase